MEPALELLLGADRLSAARRADGLDGRHPDLPRCRRVQYGGRSLHPPLPGRSARRAADGRCLSYRRAAAAILPRCGDGGLERGGDHPAVAALAALRRYRSDRRELGGDGRLDGLRSEEHTSELQSLMRISYAVFCLKK